MVCADKTTSNRGFEFLSGSMRMSAWLEQNRDKNCRIWSRTCLVTLIASMAGQAMRVLPKQWQKRGSKPYRCAMHPWGSMSVCSPQAQQVII